MRQPQTVAIRVGLYACTVMMLAAPAYANPIVNGGFESGNFAGWTLSGNTGFGTGVCLTGTTLFGSVCSANSGLYAVDSGPYPPSGSGFVSQVLATTASTMYDLTFFLRNDNLGRTPSNLFNVHWNGGVVYSLVNVPQQGYTQITLSNLLATSASTTLSFEFQNLPGGFFLDDVSARAVPEPTSLLLLGAGLTGAALRKRSRT